MATLHSTRSNWFIRRFWVPYLNCQNVIVENFISREDEKLTFRSLVWALGGGCLTKSAVRLPVDSGNWWIIVNIHIKMCEYGSQNVAVYLCCTQLALEIIKMITAKLSMYLEKLMQWELCHKWISTWYNYWSRVSASFLYRHKRFKKYKFLHVLFEKFSLCNYSIQNYT